MKMQLKILLSIVFTISTIISLFIIFVIWFDNPEFTSMQMMKTYRELYILMFISVILLNSTKYIRIK